MNPSRSPIAPRCLPLRTHWSTRCTPGPPLQSPGAPNPPWFSIPTCPHARCSPCLPRGARQIQIPGPPNSEMSGPTIPLQAPWEILMHLPVGKLFCRELKAVPPSLSSSVLGWPAHCRGASRLVLQTRHRNAGSKRTSNLQSALWMVRVVGAAPPRGPGWFW